MNKIYSIQLLRAIACLLVLQVHYIPYLPFINKFICGSIGVDIFFIISGYIIAASISSGSDNFFIKRVSRVAPYYYLITLIVIFILLSKGESISGSKMLKTLFFIAQPEEPILGVGWSINHEMLFYFLISIIIMFFRNLKAVGLLFLLLLFSFQLFRPTNYFISFLQSSVNYLFVFGWFAFIYRDWLKRLRHPLFLIVTSSLFIAVSHYTVDYGNLVFPVYYRDQIFFLSNPDVGYVRLLIWGIPSMLLFMSVLSFEPVIKRYPDNVLIKIDDRSYTIYLIQTLPLLLIGFPTNIYSDAFWL